MKDERTAVAEGPDRSNNWFSYELPVLAIELGWRAHEGLAIESYLPQSSLILRYLNKRRW